MKNMKKILSIILSVSMLTGVAAFGESQPPEKPDGDAGAPSGDMGTPPDGQGGPGGDMGGAPDGQGGPGGNSASNIEYTAVYTVSDTQTLTGTIESTGTDENAVLVDGGDAEIQDAQISRVSEESSGGDNSSFYGVGAAVLAIDGTANVSDSTIDTTANGAAGVFAYGTGTATVSNCEISTTGNTAGGIHVAGGGTLYANDLTVTTQGESSAAIRSDRGGGTMVVNGGSYSSNGTGSPAVYVTADITVSDASLTANGSEALCLEGLNTVRLNNCVLSGNMQDLSQNDNTWTVILYQSMSGDSEVGCGVFEMSGGTLNSENGGLFYTTNTESVFTLQNVKILKSADCEYFLRCTGNSNERGWGTAGANGADCTFTAIEQTIDGNIIYDSISNLTVSLTDGSSFTGAVIDDESCAGDGGNGACALNIDGSSAWIVTGNSTLTSLTCSGIITDADSNTVTITGTDGTVYVEGTSPYTITVDTYSSSADLTAVNTIDQY